MTRQTWILLLLLSMLWGGSFLFQAVAVTEIPVFTIVWSRVLLAALVLWLVIAATGARAVWSRAAVIACLGMSVTNNAVPFSLIIWGQSHIAVGLASILNATTPLWTVLALHAFTRDDRLTGRKIAAVALGLAGVAVLVGPEALGSGGPLLPQLAVLGGALSYGLGGVWSRRFKGLGLSPPAIAAGQLTGSSLILLPLVLLVDQPWTLPTPGLAPVLSVLGLALLSTALAYVLFFRILDLAGPATLSLVTLLIPVSATGLGWAVLGQSIGPGELAGAALIGLGLAVMDGRPIALLRRTLGRAKTGA
jgi:drug/metabolite transporter (DMT)-like permease